MLRPSGPRRRYEGEEGEETGTGEEASRGEQNELGSDEGVVESGGVLDPALVWIGRFAAPSPSLHHRSVLLEGISPLESTLSLGELAKVP